ncbi:MAG: hypothetical protein R3B06_07130 [Kofleriaceae bacterium]
MALEPTVVELAGGQPRQRRHLLDHEAAGVEAGAVGQVAAHHVAGALDHQADPPVAGQRRHRRRARRGASQGLQLVQVHSLAEHLGQAIGAAVQPQPPVAIQVAVVAGVQHAALVVAAGQIGGALGVAEHDVGAPVDHLAHLAGGHRLAGALDGEGATGDDPPDRAAVGRQLVGRQDGDARGGLGLAVHDDQPPAAGDDPRVDVVEKRRGHRAAGLGEGGQRRRRHLRQIEPPQQLEGERHPGQRGRAVVAAGPPETLGHHAVAGDQHGGAGAQVAGDHRQSVGVVHRQAGRRHLPRPDAEVTGDGAGVGRDRGGRQPHQLGAAGRARGRHQERQVRVHRRVTASGRRQRPAPHHRRAVPLEQRRRQGLVEGTVHQRRRYARGQRAQEAHDRRHVVGDEQHRQPGPGRGAQLGRGLVDLRGQRGVGDGRAGRAVDERRRVGPAAGQDQRHNRSPPSTPTTWPVT